MKKITLFVLALALAMAAPSFAQTTTQPEQKICPVLDSPIDKNVYLDYEGQRIYFCCAGCIDAFKADPKKYMKKLNDEKSKSHTTTHKHEIKKDMTEK